jgi:two-component system, response regulator PdtaR
MQSAPEILVVEDNLLLRFDLADRLRECGYLVREASHARQAIAILEACPDIRAVITDIEMPGSAMDGLALAAAISDRWPPCKLIIVSGRNLPPPDQLPNDALFLAKPVAFEAVVQRLAAWGLAA